MCVDYIKEQGTTVRKTCVEHKETEFRLYSSNGLDWGQTPWWLSFSVGNSKGDQL